MKARPNPRALEWLSLAPDSCLSVLTLGELERGVYLLGRRYPDRAARISDRLTQLREHYTDRILAVDAAAASRWATLPATRTLPVVDGLLAATALAHGLTIATRNVRDFAGTGVEICNPFGAKK
ncbi:type II toxin-antitoxin system VapC family toxin [Leucobacter insecticola]|uniref:Type II toxin-antitoxin system VapC family toxin n=2 Tax=Leucobacter insecticola TaxID=2714934 RepID=A0A6G8FLF5_9MICO|nr:type II toxin-antitoxin system VapC family toxin [Leucobacter insecticola]